MGLYKNLWSLLENKRKVQLLLLLPLMIIASLLEIISIGAVVPFLGILTNSSSILDYEILSRFIFDFLNIESDSLVVLIGIIFAVAAALSGCVRMMLVYAQTKLSYAIGADLSEKVYDSYLNMPYMMHLTINSSQIISTATTKTTRVVNESISPILNIISSLCIMSFIVGLLIYIDYKVAFASFFSFGVLYALVSVLTKTKLTKFGLVVATDESRVVKTIQEGAGGIRDVILDHSQKLYVKKFKKLDKHLRQAQANILIIATAPRFILETLGMIVLATLSVYLTKTSGFTGSIPVLGGIALAAQRVLPLLQQCYFSLTLLRGNSQTVQEVLFYCSKPIPNVGNSVLDLNSYNEISFNDVCFSYAGSNEVVLKNINLVIRAGETIGVVGKTGSGKSTFADILMGLLEPTSGELRIDGQIFDGEMRKSFQSRVAHVPQSIFLTDGNILDNVAFGVDSYSINMDLLDKAARDAEIFDYIDSLPAKFTTLVGERGVKLSGGQRQRIGIARALYKNSLLLVLDEATSALDEITESNVMNNIYVSQPSLTKIIIAHRISTLSNCDRIIQLENGVIVFSGTFNDYIKTKNAANS